MKWTSDQRDSIKRLIKGKARAGKSIGKMARKEPVHPDMDMGVASKMIQARAVGTEASKKLKERGIKPASKLDMDPRSDSLRELLKSGIHITVNR